MKSRKKNNAGRGKIALIGVLAVVMACVWGNAIWGGAEPERITRRTRRAPGARTRPAPAAPTPTAKTAPPRKAVVDWPTITLEEAVLNDPFARPSWAITQTAEEIEAQATSGRRSSKTAARKELEKQRASMVVIVDGSKIATIGEQEVRVGDLLNGFEVIDITREGVVLAEQRASE